MISIMSHVGVELKDTTLSKLITTRREEVGCSTFLCRVVIALVVVGKEEKIVEEKE
ncbi:hypothetical protein AAZX31_01G064800 [Glycine max]